MNVLWWCRWCKASLALVPSYFLDAVLLRSVTGAQPVALSPIFACPEWKLHWGALCFCFAEWTRYTKQTFPWRAALPEALVFTWDINNSVFADKVGTCETQRELVALMHCKSKQRHCLTAEWNIYKAPLSSCGQWLAEVMVKRTCLQARAQLTNNDWAAA